MAKAVSFLQKEIGPPPPVAAVLGSGLSAAGDSWQKIGIISYSRIAGFRKPGVAGHPGALWMVRNGDTCFVALAGRCHHYEGFSLPEIVFPVRVLASWGVTRFILTNAAGAIRPGLQPGSFMLISDHINLMGDNPLRALPVTGLGDTFPDLTQVYSASLREIARDCAESIGLELQEGVYVAVTGPNFETPAEIRMFGKLGADAVGMSTVPEVIALAQMRCQVLAISLLTNPAAGTTSEPVSHEEVLSAGTRAAEKLGRLIVAIAAKI